MIRVPLRGSPKYNEKRRQASQVRQLGERCSSLGRLSEDFNSSEALSSSPILAKSPFPEIALKPSNDTAMGHMSTSSSGYSLCNEQSYMVKTGLKFKLANNCLFFNPLED
eukprot:TsM_001046200 transcript=TsM_001046200 gene=TsM_001046200